MVILEVVLYVATMLPQDHDAVFLYQFLFPLYKIMSSNDTVIQMEQTVDTDLAAETIARLKTKYPTKVITLIVPDKGMKALAKYRFLFGHTETIASVLEIIRGQLDLMASESLYIFNGNYICLPHTTLGELNRREAESKEPKGYVILHYCKDNVFG